MTQPGLLRVLLSMRSGSGHPCWSTAFLMSSVLFPVALIMFRSVIAKSLKGATYGLAGKTLDRHYTRCPPSLWYHSTISADLVLVLSASGPCLSVFLAVVSEILSCLEQPVPRTCSRNDPDCCCSSLLLWLCHLTHWVQLITAASLCAGGICRCPRHLLYCLLVLPPSPGAG